MKEQRKQKKEQKELKKPSDYPIISLRPSKEQKKILVAKRKKFKTTVEFIDVWIKALK